MLIFVNLVIRFLGGWRTPAPSWGLWASAGAAWVGLIATTQCSLFTHQSNHRLPNPLIPNTNGIQPFQTPQRDRFLTRNILIQHPRRQHIELPLVDIHRIYRVTDRSHREDDKVMRVVREKILLRPNQYFLLGMPKHPHKNTVKQRNLLNNPHFFYLLV